MATIGEQESEGSAGIRRQCGHSHRALKKRAHPAKKKSPQRTEAAVQVDIGAAGFGEGGAKFGVAEGAEEHDESADEPGSKDQSGRADGAGHVAGDEKNARTDGVADDDRRSRPEAEAAN